MVLDRHRLGESVLFREKGILMSLFTTEVVVLTEPFVKLNKPVKPTRLTQSLSEQYQGEPQDFGKTQ